MTNNSADGHRLRDAEQSRELGLERLDAAFDFGGSVELFDGEIA